jgi:hypothetical protein
VVSARGRGRRVYKVCTDDLRACLCRQDSALHMARRRVRNRQGGALCTSSNVSRRAGAHGLGAAHHPPLRWPAGRAHQTGSWCMCIARSRIPCGLVLSTHLLQRSNSWRFRGVQHEGALREARAGHVNSRLNIAKIVTKINTTRSPRPLPARSMYHSAHTSVNCEAQNQHPMYHSAHTSVNSEAHVRGSHASIDDWGRMWQFFWTPAFLTFRHHWSALCNDATVTRRTI